jgi:hypothetical protein
VPILFGEHRFDRRERDFGGRVDGTGREIVREEEHRKSKRSRAQLKWKEQSDQDPGTGMFLIARDTRALARWESAERRSESARGHFERYSHHEFFRGDRTL